MLSKLKKKIDRDIHFKELLTGSSVTFLLKMLGMLLGYALIYVISNRNGAEGVGNYNIFLKTIMVVGTLTSLGINVAVLRYVGQFDNPASLGTIKSLYNQGFKTVFLLSVFTSLIIYFNAETIVSLIGKSKEQIFYLKLLSIGLPFFSLNKVNVEFIRGFKKLQLSELIRSVIRPIFIIIMLLVWRKNDFDNFDILSLLLIGIFLNWIISSLVILKKIKSLNKFKQNLFSHKELISTSFPMMITSASTVLLISLPVFFLDYFHTQTEVGIFSVVYQISMLISIIMIIINTIVAPKFSSLYWANKIVTLQRFINQSVNLTFLIALFSSITVIFFSNYILNIFGSEFLLGKDILIVLVIGQLVSSCCGSVGILMNMVGEQNAQRNINLITLIICFFLYLLIVPKYSLMGSSSVFMFGLVFKNIVSTIYVKKKMGLNTFFNPFNKI